MEAIIGKVVVEIGVNGIFENGITLWTLDQFCPLGWGSWWAFHRG
jgi:hypothetical protein